MKSSKIRRSIFSLTTIFSLIVFFVVTISPAFAAWAGFSQSTVSFGNGNQPLGVAAGDLNHDGNSDIVSAIASSGIGVSVILGNGHGQFSNPIYYTTGPGGYTGGVTISDVNGDGKPDIVAQVVTNNTALPCSTSTWVAVLLGNGDGTFQAPNFTCTKTTDTASDVLLGDLNHDSKLDLVVGGVGTGLNVFLGNGDGTFQAPTNYLGNDSTGFFVLKDFNGDGNLDIAASDDDAYPSGHIAVLLGKGDGTFQAPVMNGPLSSPGNITSVDFNGDGKLDLAVSDYQGDSVTTFMGNGDGTFSNQNTIQLPASSYPTGIAAADFNGDGKADIIVGGIFVNSYNEVGILPGNGDGTFQPVVPLSSTCCSSPQYIAVGDFNNDNLQDFVVTAMPTFGISIFQNQGSTQPLTLNLPSNITAYPTSSSGAAISYTVTTSGGTGTSTINCSPSSGSTFPIGTTTVNCSATDTGGGSASGSFQVTVVQPIALSLPANITTNATSPSGANVTYTVSASGGINPPPSVSCNPSPKSVFPIGTTTVNCTATDTAGHSVNSSFTITVTGAVGQISNLITTVNSFHLPSGIQNSFDSQLQVVLADLNAGNTSQACIDLTSFINHVKSQSGKGLTVSQANQLLAAAQQVQVVLGC